MAKTFNLTAQLNLAGPNNIKPIINNIRQQLGNISVGVNVKINPSTINAVTSFDKRLKALNTTLVQINGTAAGLTTTLNQLGSAFTAFNSAGNAAKNITASARALKQVQQNAGAARTQMEEFGRQAALAVRRFTAFSVATGAIFGVVGALKEGFAAAIKFDKEMVKLSQVTGLSVRNLSDISKEITDLSTKLGVSSAELSNVATTLAQAGLSAKDTKVALEALAKSSLAPSFKDINETTEASIAIMAQFGLKAKDLEGVLGSVNAVSAAFAVEAEDITAAIRRAGGVFATAAKGISAPKDALNEFIAIFSSVRSTTRESAETIATGLRTIFTRIQRGSTIELLKKFGVELTDLEGKFVGPYEAVNRLSEALNRIDPRDTQFSQIVEELGGFRQISKVIPLIQQFQARTEALAVAQKGSTSLTEAANVAQESLANQFAKVREKFLAFVRSVSETSSFKTIISLTLKLADGLITVADAAKPLIPLLAIIGAVKGFSALKQLGGGFFGGLKGGGVGGGFPGGTGGGGSSGPGGPGGPGGVAAATATNTTSVNQNTYAIQQLTAAIQRFAYNKFGTPYPVGASSPLPRKFARGGLVPGSGHGDTVPAMLAPGEFVLRKAAVNSIGAGKLSSVNLLAGGGDKGLPVDFDSLSPSQQQKILRAANAKTKEQIQAEIVARRERTQERKNDEARSSGKVFRLDSDNYAGVFSQGLPRRRLVAAADLNSPKSGGDRLTEQLAGFKIKDKKGIKIEAKPAIYKVDRGEFNRNIADIIPKIIHLTGGLVQQELGKKLVPDNVKGIIENQFAPGVRSSISGTVFEAAFKAVAGNNSSSLFRGESSQDNFDLYPSTRDKSANFETLLGNAAGKNLKRKAYADAKFNGSDEAYASLITKALAKGNKIHRLAAGGHIGGSGTGDSVPALLTPGEFVINKRAADSIGRDVLHGMNTGKVGKFAGGTPFPRTTSLRGLKKKAALLGQGPGGIAALAGGAYIAQQGVDTAFGQESPVSSAFGATIGGAASGAYLGAQVGKFGGAPGAAIGAGVGAVLGGLTAGVTTFQKATKDLKVKEAFDKLATSANNVESAFEDLVKGTLKNPATLNRELGEFGAGAAKAAATNTPESSTSTFLGKWGEKLFQAKGWFVDISEERKKDQAKENQARESSAQQTFQNAQPGANVAEQLLERQIRLGGGKLVERDKTGRAVLTEEGKKNQGTLEALAFKGTRGLQLVKDIQNLETLRQGGNISDAEFEKQKKFRIDQASKQSAIEVQNLAQKQKDLLDAYRNSGKELVAFNKIFAQIGAIAEANTALLEANNAALDARTANLTGQGTVGPVNSGLSRVLGNKDAFNTPQYAKAADQLVGVFGNNKALASTAAFAKGGKTLDDDLTKIISDALIGAKKEAGSESFAADEGGNGTVIQRVQEGVAKLGLPAELAKSVSTVISSELTNRQGSTFEDIVEKFKNADKFAESAKVAQEALQKLGESFDKATAQYTQNLNKLVGLRGASLGAGDRAAGIRASNTIELAEAFGKELTAQQLNAPIQGQISRLGGGITDPNALAAKFSDLNDQAAVINAKQNIALIGNKGDEFVKLGQAAAETAVEIDRTKKALELLADGTRKAAIQTKLAEQQQKREAGRNFLSAVGTAGPQQQFQFFKQAAAFIQFRQQGNQLNGNPQQAADLQGFIQLVGPLLGKQKNDQLTAQFADAVLGASGPFGAALKTFPKEIQDAIRAAITGQGQAPEEQLLIAELQKVQTAQQQAADALTKIADKAENVYGKQIVSILREFVDSISAQLRGLNPEVPFQVAAPTGRNQRPPVQFVPSGFPFAKGGPVYAAGGGSMFKPMGTDTVPAMLTPGEFVVNARAAQANRGLLEDINAQYLAGGGPAEKAFNYEVRKRESRERVLAAKTRLYNSGRISLNPSLTQQGISLDDARDASSRRVGDAQARLHKAGRLHGADSKSELDFDDLDNFNRQPFRSVGNGAILTTLRDYQARDLITSRAQARAARRGGGGSRGSFNTNSGFGGVQANVQSRAASRAAARRGRLGYASGGEVGGASGTAGYDNFVKAVQNLGTYTDKLANIKIPETITLTATINPVQVVFSGENALASAVVEKMSAQISSMVYSAMKAHINPLTGETNEGTINPSQINNRV